METTPYGKKTLGQSCVTIAGVNCKKKTGGFGGSGLSDHCFVRVWSVA